MNDFDLGEYHKRFPEVLRTRYGQTFEAGFKKIEGLYKEVRSGSRDLTAEDVMAIFDDDLPFVHNWTKPDCADIAERMESKRVANQIRSLGNGDYNLNLITEIWKCFRELSLTSLVLHHVYPNSFAMCSHHLASLLYIAAPTVPKFYVKYCTELREWSKREWPTRVKLTVVETEYALWTWYRLAHYGREEEQKKHRNAFKRDRWVQGRRAVQIADSLGTIGKLDLARHYLDVRPTVAALIAWCELEPAVRSIVQKTGDQTDGKSFRGLIGMLPEEALSRNLTKGDLEDLWYPWRNKVVHYRKEMTREMAESVVDLVEEFIKRNGPFE